MASPSKDPYTILSITKTATAAEITAAYRRPALKHLPDRGGDAKIFILIGEAKDLLLDPINRQHFDASGWHIEFRSDNGFTGAQPFTARPATDRQSRAQSPPPQPRKWSDDTWDRQPDQGNARQARENANRKRRGFEDLQREFEELKREHERSKADMKRAGKADYWRNAYMQEKMRPCYADHGHGRHRHEESEDSHFSESESESDDDRRGHRGRGRGRSSLREECRPRRKHRFRFWKNKTDEEIRFDRGVERGKRILEERGHRLFRIPGRYIGF